MRGGVGGGDHAAGRSADNQLAAQHHCAVGLVAAAHRGVAQGPRANQCGGHAKGQWRGGLPAASRPRPRDAAGQEHQSALSVHRRSMLGRIATVTPAMTRPVLAEDQIHPAIRQSIASLHIDVVRSVQEAVATHPVVVVGMGGNPFVRKARRALDVAGVAHKDLDFGNYFSDWRRRNALKLWTGWPTFPMVFVRGVLVGGATDVRKLIDSGELARTLAA